MKKLINSSLLMVCALLGTTQANAMLRKCMMAGGIGVTGSLCKKYFYDPLTIKRKYRKYLAPQNVQKLSNQLLDAHLKTGGDGLKKRLLVKYLKTFGYNRVYILNNKLFSEFSGQPLSSPKIGMTYWKGGIFFNSKSHKIKDQKQLLGMMGHENAHLYRGDTTRLYMKFPYLYIAPHLITNILKKRSFSKGAESFINEVHSKIDEVETLTCKKNVRTLFYSGHFEALSSLFFTRSIFTKLSESGPYSEGRLRGLLEIVDENPEHPLAPKLAAYTKALKNEKQTSMWNFGKWYWNEALLTWAEIDLKAALKRMDRKTSKQGADS